MVTWGIARQKEEQLGFVPPCTEQACIDNQVITNLLIQYFRLKSSCRSKNRVGHLNTKKIQLLDSQIFIIYMVGANHNCARQKVSYVTGYGCQFY
jgi:hypothetical protein